MPDLSIKDLKERYSKTIYQYYFPSWHEGKNIKCVFHEDSKPSLSIYQASGEYKHKCHGCDISGDCIDIIKQIENMDTKQSIERFKELAGVNNETSKRIVKTYDYLDASGKLIFQVIRYEPKDFRQRRPDGKGGWIYNLQGVEVIPYNLPEVLKSSYVFITEGERDVETLKELGLVASCNPQGAGKWRPEFNQYFKDKSVYVLPDNDGVGRRHALQVAKNLKGIASSVKVVEVPELKDKQDISDWIALRQSQGKSKEEIKEELKKIVKECPGWMEPPSELENDDADDFDFDHKLFPPVPFPFEAFPGELMRFINKVSLSHGIDREVTASLILALASGALGNAVRIAPKEGYEVPPFLWLILCASSGYGKSPAIQTLFKPIREVQARIYKDYQVACREYEKALRKAKSEPGFDIPDKPQLRHKYVSDLTVEALSNFFELSPRGGIVLADELASLVLSFNQYKGRGFDRQIFKELFNCQSWQIDRKTAGIKFIPNTGVSIIGGIQPKVFPLIFAEDSFEDGLLPRFLIINAENRTPTFTLEEISKRDMIYWSNLLSKCYELPLEIDAAGLVKPKIIRLSDDALNIWVKFYNDSFAKSRFLSEKTQVFMPKLLGYYSLKFAGILLAIKSFDAGLDIPYECDLETIADAIGLTKYFIWQAIKTVGAYEEGLLTEYEKRLIETLYSLRNEVNNGKLPLSKIVDAFNNDLPNEANHTPERIAKMLAKLGLRTQRGSHNLSSLIWEPERIQKLFSKITLTTLTTLTNSDKSPKLDGGDVKDVKDDLAKSSEDELFSTNVTPEENKDVASVETVKDVKDVKVDLIKDNEPISIGEVEGGKMYYVLKDIKFGGKEYKAGDIIRTDADFVGFFLEQKAILSLREAFEKEYGALYQWLVSHPLDMQSLQEHRPELYVRLKSLFKEIDKCCENWDYRGFFGAVNDYKQEHLKVIRQGYE